MFRLGSAYENFLHRLHARLCALGRFESSLVFAPEPRLIGSVVRGQKILAGELPLAGHLVKLSVADLWKASAPEAAFEQELHGFLWLDDLAAVGGSAARDLARIWLEQWIAQYGRGAGVGWTPQITAWRLLRWLCHAPFLLEGENAYHGRAFYRLLGQKALFLSRRWRCVSPGVARLETLTSLICACTSLQGMGRHISPASAALARECQQQITAQGGIGSRNPTELLHVLSLLTWAAQALRESGKTPAKAHTEAIRHTVPCLRLLRHADGGLARFHGGQRGREGQLDRALATSGIRTRPAGGMLMGYARLSSGRSSVIVDAAPPPAKGAAPKAHASTLAFEMTGGRGPIVVNCGAGTPFGKEWHRAARATPSHSTLVLDGVSSARLATPPPADWRQEAFTQAPHEVQAALKHLPSGLMFEGTHDGFLRTYGLVHTRKLHHALGGETLGGTDTLAAPSSPARAQFDRIFQQRQPRGISFHIRFHLHPEARPTIDRARNAVSIVLGSAEEVWMFRHDGTALMTLEPSFYADDDMTTPRESQQIVLFGKVSGYLGRVSWTLSRQAAPPS